jgi:hypothetical protein
MIILIDEILQEVVDQAYGYARLGRTVDLEDCEALFAEVLAELEADGDAMRYLNSKAQIAWRATPKLCDYLTDLRLDAEADFADEEI